MYFVPNEIHLNHLAYYNVIRHLHKDNVVLFFYACML
nr:MAG TPA: hypothetical protein [Caudoviricetes sp.]